MNKNIKKIIALLMAILFINILGGCSVSSTTPTAKAVQQEEPHLYYKDIKVRVIQNDAYTWFALTRRYQQKITVKSDEYNLEKTFDIYAQGTFDCPAHFSAQPGDVINAELWSWKMESTGKIVKREINQLE